MKNRIIIAELLAVAPLLLSAQTAQPNIVLFLVDDMGWQDTSVPFWDQETPFNHGKWGANVLYSKKPACRCLGRMKFR